MFPKSAFSTLVALGVILCLSPVRVLAAYGRGGGGHGGGGGSAHFSGGSFGGPHFGGSAFGGTHFGGGYAGHSGFTQPYSAPHISMGGSYTHAPAFHSVSPYRGGVPSYHAPMSSGSVQHWAGLNASRGAPATAFHPATPAGAAGHGSGTSTVHGLPGSALHGGFVHSDPHGGIGHAGATNAFRHEQAVRNAPAFRTNWNRNFDRSNLAAFRRGEHEEHEGFHHFFGGFGGGFFGGWPFWGFGGYPFLDFSYLPYFADYGAYPGYYNYGLPYGYAAAENPYYAYGNSYSIPPVSYAESYAAPDDGTSAALGYAAAGPIEPAMPAPAAENGTAATGGSYLTDALDAFRRGDYHDAVRLGEHAAVDAPQGVQVHRLMAQALFALGAYPSAAIESHAALSLGTPLDWATLVSYYGDASAYTTQLRALEAYVRDHPSAPDGRFLLGYEYLMMGYQEQAREQFAESLRLVPADEVAKKAIANLGPQAAK